MARPHPPRRRRSRHSKSSLATTSLLTSSLLLLTLLSTAPSTTVLADSPGSNFAALHLPRFLQVAKAPGIKAQTTQGSSQNGAGRGGGSGGTGTMNTNNNNNNNNNNMNNNSNNKNNQAASTNNNNNNKNGASNTSPQQAAPTSLNPTAMMDMGLDLQTFTRALGGIKAPSITMSGKQGQPFMVQQEAIGDFMSASMKTCDIQLNMCQQMANQEQAAQQQAQAANKNGKNKAVKADAASFASDLGIKSRFTSMDCTGQMQQCVAAQKNAPFQSFKFQMLGPDPNDPNFDLLCAP